MSRKYLKKISRKYSFWPKIEVGPMYKISKKDINKISFLDIL